MVKITLIGGEWWRIACKDWLILALSNGELVNKRIKKGSDQETIIELIATRWVIILH